MFFDIIPGNAAVLDAAESTNTFRELVGHSSCPGQSNIRRQTFGWVSLYRYTIRVHGMSENKRFLSTDRAELIMKE